MSAQHTPGPWSTVEDCSDIVAVVDARGFSHVEVSSVAVLHGYRQKLGVTHWALSPEGSRDLTPEERAANACLIAAAPELLEALLAATRAINWRYVDDSTQDRVRDAIAKATGASE